VKDGNNLKRMRLLGKQKREGCSDNPFRFPNDMLTRKYRIITAQEGLVDIINKETCLQHTWILSSQHLYSLYGLA
jgi:hypothetical protein